ncbi:NAD(P)-binding protein [Pseudovirgaria hyperparasitica]|uniref:NAD(P)-binding protein n=1 Tax=Pseudovirgaria hyperparasitica TaxID=470096 RepID=A0A6A6WLM1_9PEZI|nr:NAD(P)-binding protein [Pseudovirgaria hyperparasitica]KAF2763105.1 NAD(P)-binding protein [Pseudovirgaria hyperparasitica]
MASYLITGTSRGLGLELVSQLAARPVEDVRLIIATARNTEAGALQTLATEHKHRIELLSLDVTSQESISAAVKQVETLLGGKGLDVLVNNAGVCTYITGAIDQMNNLDDVFRSNVTSVHMMTTSFIPLLREGDSKTVVNLSTTVGTFGMQDYFAAVPCPAYKITKAALNMLTVQYAQDYKKEGFTIIALTPGWLRTDLGGEYADLSVRQGATGSLEIIERARKDRSMTGKLWNVKVEGYENPEPGKQVYDGGNPVW